MHAVTVSCTSPVWHDGSNARRDPPAFGFPFSSTASSRSAVPAPWHAPQEHSASSELHLNFPNPFGAVSSSGAPKGLRQHAPMPLDMRIYEEARHSGPAFQHKTFAPLDAPSSMNVFSVGMPMAEGQATTRLPGGDQGGARPLEAGPPGDRPCVQQSCVERSCVERPCVQAVMDYLDGPLARNFDFMFADEEGGALLDGCDTAAGASAAGGHFGARCRR